MQINLQSDCVKTLQDYLKQKFILSVMETETKKILAVLFFSFH